MKGVILFADDKLIDTNSNEFKLYQELSKDTPTIAVSSLEQAEQTLHSIGTFKAILLDWDFGNQGTVEEGVVLPNKDDETFDFLQNQEFYSLVYVFSTIAVDEKSQWTDLTNKYGSRIKFKPKGDLSDIQNVKSEIERDIETWINGNKHLEIPLLWSNAINQSFQKIFQDLSEADNAWMKAVYDAGHKDGAQPELFVIELLQLILSEEVIKNKPLLEKINELKGGDEIRDSNSLNKIFNKLYYTTLTIDSPIMTGDICVLDKDTFGILMSPECDMRVLLKKDENYLDFLIFKKNAAKPYIDETVGDNRGLLNKNNPSRNEKKIIGGMRRIFNQEEIRIHILPSIDGKPENIPYIDFRLCSMKIKSEELKRLERPYKLNSPFIQQLRQRYLAYLGRVGVPAMPDPLRDWHLQ